MKITVYSASSAQVAETYVAAARCLGNIIAQRKHVLINGAGKAGLMGSTADACLAAGGEAIGIITRLMNEKGWQHAGLDRHVVTADVLGRKGTLADMSDACIALPGGGGTLEELLEIITWKQLGLYLKPIIILNTDNYFAPLLQQLDKAADEHFMRALHRNIWCVAKTPAEAVTLAETTPLWNAEIRKFAAL